MLELSYIVNLKDNVKNASELKVRTKKVQTAKKKKKKKGKLILEDMRKSPEEMKKLLFITKAEEQAQSVMPSYYLSLSNQ